MSAGRTHPPHAPGRDLNRHQTPRGSWPTVRSGSADQAQHGETVETPVLDWMPTVLAQPSARPSPEIDRHVQKALFPRSPARLTLATTRRGRGRSGHRGNELAEGTSQPRLRARARHPGRLHDWNVDKDGVDVTLRSGALMVDLQLKCTQNPRIVRGGYSFDLDVETYDKLRNPDRSAPAHLALLIVPPDISRWVTHQPESIVLACHGYWASLQGLGKANGSVTTAISLPEHQPLTVKGMGTMFDTARRLISTVGREVD
jgi:uncharacterized protein DUF4365